MHFVIFGITFWNHAAYRELCDYSWHLLISNLPGFITIHNQNIFCFYIGVVNFFMKAHPSLEALRTAAGVPSIAAQAQQQFAVAYAKVYRLPTNHPRRTMFEGPCRHGLKRPTWCSTAKALTNQEAMANWHPRTHHRQPRRAFKPSAS